LQTDPEGHAMPQPPQWYALFVVSTQALPHLVSAAPQLLWQLLPPLQTCPEAHMVPQPPQLLASAGTQVSPHAMRPALHWHLLAWQLWPAPQALPQAPQFC